MADNETETNQQHSARMELDADTLHEGERGFYLDCPACGASVSMAQVIEEGHCSGVLDADETEVESDDTQLQGTECTAKLSLELVWTE
ncbi:hypothetical protein [Halobellus sp. GM3]|uniref:hypothetical protein n=1 Tax=Halobellus sp. GM3 TaxID=3458410 RepID=UPI00403DEB16